ncbi:hypothetical protein WAI453_000522 [Rhynchosporium graminicola]
MYFNSGLFHRPIQDETDLSSPLLYKAPFPELQGNGDPKTDFPPIRACLFDMDGILINTEDIYTKCHNILLARYNAGPMTCLLSNTKTIK